MMKRIYFFGFLLTLLSCSFSSKENQSDNLADSLSVDQNIGEQEANTFYDPEIITDENLKTQEVHFTELWIWEYLSEEEKWKELWVYHHPELNYWLFDRSSSYGISSEMCKWILAKPNGEYWLNCQAAEMNTADSFLVEKVDFEDPDDLTELWKAMDQYQNFGDPEISRETFKGERYEVDFKAQAEVSEFYLFSSDIDFRPIYYFNQMQGDAQLPIFFPTDIPKNLLVLSEKTDFPHQDLKIEYRFKEVAPDSYYISLPIQK